MLATANVNENVRFEPDESPPSLVTIGAGIQAAMLIVAPVVLTVVIVARIAEQPESYMSWGVFAALLVSGVTTVHQAVRVGRDRSWAPCSSWARRGLSSRCASRPWSRAAPLRWRAS